mgnify:FL=1
MPYCTKCGKQVIEDDLYCPACGTKLRDAERSEQGAQTGMAKLPRSKSLTVTMLWAILPGLLVGVAGIGHFHQGRVKRGLAILLGTWILDGGAITSFAFAVNWHTYRLQDMRFAILAGSLLAASLGLFIWQIFDARSIGRKRNESLSRTSP